MIFNEALKNWLNEMKEMRFWTVVKARMGYSLVIGLMYQAFLTQDHSLKIYWWFHSHH